MQGKGAGPVNRVELESQVLCAALRQSCHLKDKIGAFTSVRELSHLFPDLLPPPEKDDDHSNSNKSNYYSVLLIRPQTAANGVLAAYLRAVRRFLRAHNAVEERSKYHTILNAGFVLRKPRLRLSHDLVVARRWLHEESRLAAVSQQEVTVDTLPIYQVQVQRAGQTVAPPAAASNQPRPPVPPQPVPSRAPAAHAMPPHVPPPAAPVPVPPSPVPPTPAQPAPVPVAAAVVQERPKVQVPPVPPLPAIAAEAPQAPVAEHPAIPAPLPVVSAQAAAHVSAAPAARSAPPPVEPAVPANRVPPPPVPLEAAKISPAGPTPPPLQPTPPSQPPAPPLPVQRMAPPLPAEPPAPVPAEPAVASSPPPLPLSVEPAAPVALPVEPPAIEPVKPLPLQVEAPASEPSPVPMSVEPAAIEPSAPEPVSAPSQPKVIEPRVIEPKVIEPKVIEPAFTPAPAAEETPAVPMPVFSPAAETAQPQIAPVAKAAPEPVELGFPPAAMRAQEIAASPPAAAAPERPAGRISKQAAFVFDESQLRKPMPAESTPMPMVVQLLEAARIIGPLEVQALKAQMEFAPNIPVEKHILNAGYVTLAEMKSIQLGESLLQSGKITMAQFQVAFYDERNSGLRMAESLQVRGWLSVEVRNAIDDWQRKRQ